jgi:hypothetical protein
VQTKRDLQISVIGAGYGEGEVLEDAFAEALPVGEPMRRREIDARLPCCGFDTTMSAGPMPVS